MNYTKNYKLPQWVEEDRILMEDFNQMCATIDSGLHANAQSLTEVKSAADGALKVVTGEFYMDGSEDTGDLLATYPSGPKFVVIYSDLSTPIISQTDVICRMYFGGWTIYRDIVLDDTSIRLGSSNCDYAADFRYIAFY